MIKNRNYSLDLLRVIACYLVIQQHASEFYYIGEGGTVVTGSNTFWIGIITTLCRSSVPLFVMLSGFLLLPMQDKISTFFRKRFTRIVYPFIAWCVLYAGYYVLSRGDSFSQMALNILHIPVNFGCEIGHLWYIYMLIGLYLVTPIISPWLQQASKRELEGYLGLWIITTFLPYIHLVYPEVLGEAFWNDTPLLYYFTGFIGYFILGYYLKRFGYPSAALSWIILIVGFALSAGIFCSRIDISDSSLQAAFFPFKDNRPIREKRPNVIRNTFTVQNPQLSSNSGTVGTVSIREQKIPAESRSRLFFLFLFR